MDVMLTALRRLFPPGSAWRLPGNLGKLVQGLAVSLEAARVLIRGLLTESIPWTASAMLAEWSEALGQVYDSTQGDAYNQRKLDAIQTALGSSTLNALNAQVRKEFSTVTISEVSAGAIVGAAECGVAECGAADGSINPYYYLISGSVANDTYAARVIAICDHFAPRHLSAYSSLTILSDTGTTELGVGLVGKAECGYAP
jgi:hypothetical protein